MIIDTWSASAPEWITAGASVLALFGVFAIVWQIFLQKRQLIRDIENDYVQRYWQIRDEIDAAEPGSAEERRWRFAYVRLCEDEIDLHDMPGRVTRATWSQWNNGMKAELLSNKLYAELIEAASSDSLVGVRSLLNGAERPTGA